MSDSIIKEETKTITEAKEFYIYNGKAYEIYNDRSLLEDVLGPIERFNLRVIDIKAYSSIKSEVAALKLEFKELDYALTDEVTNNSRLIERLAELTSKIVQITNEVIELKEENKHLNIYTCYKCSDKKTCQYAYDAYNTNDDCLAIK